MKNYAFILLFICAISFILVLPPPPAFAQETPEYIGTWKGVNIFGWDITVIVDEINYEIDLYITGTTILEYGSQKGTHDTPTPNTECKFEQKQMWDGSTWVDCNKMRTINYSISGNSMMFLYDETFPFIQPWVLGGQLIKQ